MSGDLVERFLIAAERGQIGVELGKRAVRKLARQSLDKWPPDLLGREGGAPDDFKDGGPVEEAVRGLMVLRLTADLITVSTAVEEAWRGASGQDIGGRSSDLDRDLEEALNELSLAGITEAMGFDR